MLVAALGLTVLGFAFLVAAVATGEIAWAWACIAVGALGLVLLLLDLVRGRASGGREPGDPTDPSDEKDESEEADARADG